MNEINKDRIIQDFATNIIRLGNECRDWAAECRMLSDKNKLLQTEVESLMTNPTSRLLRAEREENARKIHGLQQDNEALQNRVDFLEG